MQILVLGSSGFVGRNVKETFDESGFNVIGRSKRDGWDLTDESRSLQELRDIRPDVIVNCAAVVGSLNYVTEQAADVADQNLRMLVNLYRGCQQATPWTTIINPVANCAFPGHLNLYQEDLFWDGAVHPSVLSYGNTRRMLVVLSECYRMQHGLRSINFFVPNMYGPYDSTDPNKAHALNALVGKVVKAKALDEPELAVWGTGVAVREWLYARDFARIVMLTLDRLAAPEFDQPINIAQRQGWSVRELVGLIAGESCFKGAIRWDATKPDGAPCKIMEDRRFRGIFPDFQFTDLRAGLRATLGYYESLYPYPEGVA
jgi:GDP-L-fucose synthase